jgi:hypothetical protein
MYEFILFIQRDTREPYITENVTFTLRIKSKYKCPNILFIEIYLIKAEALIFNVY